MILQLGITNSNCSFFCPCCSPSASCAGSAPLTTSLLLLQSPVPREDVDTALESKAGLQEEEEQTSVRTSSPLPTLKSEDSGIGLSASSPELCQHLGVPTVTLERDDVWKKGGSIQKTLHCIQELVAKFASKYIFGMQLQEMSPEGIAAINLSGKEKKENGYRLPESGSKKKSPWDGKQITVPQVKQMLSELFSARGSPFRSKNSTALLSEHKKEKEEEEEWDLELVLGPLRGDCKEAFSAACHLLLDCTTFPVYLAEEEMEQLYLSLFQGPGKNCSFLSIFRMQTVRAWLFSRLDPGKTLGQG